MFRIRVNGSNKPFKLFAETGGAGDKDFNLSVFNIIEEYLKSDKVLKHSMDDDKEI